MQPMYNIKIYVRRICIIKMMAVCRLPSKRQPTQCNSEKETKWPDVSKLKEKHNFHEISQVVRLSSVKNAGILKLRFIEEG